MQTVYVYIPITVYYIATPIIYKILAEYLYRKYNDFTNAILTSLFTTPFLMGLIYLCVGILNIFIGFLHHDVYMSGHNVYIGIATLLILALRYCIEEFRGYPSFKEVATCFKLAFERYLILRLLAYILWIPFPNFEWRF
jgi:hypothetical protein